MFTSGRPFALVDVRVVGEDGDDVQEGSNKVSGVREVHVGEAPPLISLGCISAPQSRLEACASACMCSSEP